MHGAESEPVVAAEQVDAARFPRGAGSRWLMLALLVMGVGVFYALGLNHYLSWEYVHSHLESLKAQTQDHLLLVLLVFFVLYVLVTALSLPAATVVSLTGGVLLGRWLGTGGVSLASTSGAALAFLNSRYLFR